MSGGSGQEKPDVLVDVQDLKMHFPIRKRTGIFRSETQYVRAVDGVSFQVYRGETLGLVGESGCGKSTTGRALIQLHRPTAGAVYFDGKNLCAMGRQELHQERRRFQMIFQDPYASLNPRMTVGDIIAEPMEIHTDKRGSELQTEVQSLMRTVGLDPRYVRRYPHEFSGGQRQRIGIARALACKPEFVVCDEPISALDVSIQAQIMNLLDDLKQQFGLTFLFIAHDLAAVRHISDRIAVMYLGAIAEIARYDQIYSNPLHPYAEALISAVPIPDPEIEGSRQRIMLEGDVPSPINPPSGCRFHTRCPYAWERCEEENPSLRDAGDGHLVACHLLDEPERRDAVRAKLFGTPAPVTPAADASEEAEEVEEVEATVDAGSDPEVADEAEASVSEPESEDEAEGEDEASAEAAESDAGSDEADASDDEDEEKAEDA